MSMGALQKTRRAWCGLLAFVLLAACSGGSDTPSSPDDHASSSVLECEELGYACALSDVPLEIIERSKVLGDDAISMLDAETSMEDVAAWLEEQSDVVEVQADDQAVRYRLEGGRGFWIFGSDVIATRGSPLPTTVGPPTVVTPRLSSPVPAHVVGPASADKRALVLSPMYYEVPDLDDAATVASILEGTRGYEGGVNHRYNVENAPGMVNLDSYRGWGAYDVVHLSTHGKRICDDNGCRAVLAAATLDQLIGGNQSAPEKILELQVDGLEIVLGQSGTTYVVLTADFFRNEYNGGLDNTLIFVNSCEILGVQATDIADALKGTSSVFVGWTESVFVSDATAAAVAFYTELSEGGYTVDVARDLIGDLALGEATGPHPAPSLMVGGRTDGDGLRIRDVVRVMHPETGIPMMSHDSVVVEGTLGDGEADRVPYLVEVDGVKPGDAGEVTVHVEIDGVAAEPEALIDHVVDGDDSWTVAGVLDLERDVDEGDEVIVHAWVELHEKGESHHEVPVILTGSREWELQLSYSRTPVDVDGSGQPDSATGTLRLALADFQNPTTPHLVSYSVVGGTVSVDPGYQDHFCLVIADTVTFDVTPSVAGFSELVIDTSKTPMEYSLFINVDGPEYEAEFSCIHGSGADAPPGYQDPETLTRSVNLVMLDIGLDEHSTLSGDGTSGSGTWVKENRSDPGSIRVTNFTLGIAR